MTSEEIKLRRLKNQHLLSPADPQIVVKDLCGLQAQFLSHALRGLTIRSGEASTIGMVKSWTNRGTMHLFSADDLPLFLHEGRTHFLRPVDTLESDAYIKADRKAYFAQLILDAVAQGIDEREALKAVCENAGMSESECNSLFDPWGGLIRALCETGKLCHKVQEKKAYQLCPTFEPMAEDAARLELVRRYFTHFGPATIKDAAYFFATTQTNVKAWIKNPPLAETVLNGKTYFYIENGAPSGEMPDRLFLPGFDQLMLGYEKTENLFLPSEYTRDIFTRAGIVRPTLLIGGSVAGWWNLKNRKLSITMFDNYDADRITQAAADTWSDLKKIEFKE